MKYSGDRRNVPALVRSVGAGGSGWRSVVKAPPYRQIPARVLVDEPEAFLKGRLDVAICIGIATAGRPQ